jgi:c-di-GMP-binding flagellar brake protein YcgR
MLDQDKAENGLAIQDRVLVEAGLAGHATAFRTVIVRVCESELWLGLASPDHRIESMRPRQPVKLTIARTGAALLANSSFLRPLGDSKSRIFAVTRPIVLERAQRRGYVRYPIGLPVHFRHLNPATWAPLGKIATTTTKDLSPGGMLFTSEAPLEVGDDLDLTLPFSSWQRLSMSGVVKRIARGGNDGETTEAAVKFTRITSLDQEQIVRLILLTEHRRREAAMAGQRQQLSAG